MEEGTRKLAARRALQTRSSSGHPQVGLSLCLLKRPSGCALNRLRKRAHAGRGREPGSSTAGVGWEAAWEPTRENSSSSSRPCRELCAQPRLIPAAPLAPQQEAAPRDPARDPRAPRPTWGRLHVISSRNWTSGVEKLEKIEESDAGKAESRKSSLAGARILGPPGSHLQPTPLCRAQPRGPAALREGRPAAVPPAPRSPARPGPPAPRAPQSHTPGAPAPSVAPVTAVVGCSQPGESLLAA